MPRRRRSTTASLCSCVIVSSSIMCRNGIINGGTGSKSTTLGRPKLLHTISIGPCRRIRPLNSRTKLSDRRRILDGSFNSCYPLSAILLEISVNILPIRSAPHLNPFNIPRSSRTPSIARSFATISYSRSLAENSFSYRSLEYPSR
jgi:hypothetical protein